MSSNSINPNNNIDDEWSSFLTAKYDDTLSSEEEEIDNISSSNNMLTNPIFLGDAPIPTDIYISTKSKIVYLEEPIDYLNVFWNIPIIHYATPTNGVIKKQIKIISKDANELENIQQRLKTELYCEEQIIKHIDNPNGRIKFKDIRKITIGLSKKDMMNCRSKKKQAFYNCFVMIIRIKIDNIFREFHIKAFNTGKIEIPGVQNDEMFEIVLKTIIEILQPLHTYKMAYKQTRDLVLINSNFNCGFFINREILFDTLQNKYNIQAIYDPCSYPGIQCKFYYNHDLTEEEQKGTQIKTEDMHKYNNITSVSFMIFRTGSVLIVGMCDENIIQVIYKFLKSILITEFKYICQKINYNYSLKDKKKKLRKKIIYFDAPLEEVSLMIMD